MTRMRTLPVVATVGTVLAAAAALSIGVADAATTPAVQFTTVQFNSPGPDDKSNKSLNGEWFQIANKSKKPVSLTGWTVKDVAKHTYKLSGTLAAGKTITVHTGKGTANKPAGHRYWGSKLYIWNNTGDTATLRTGKGAVVDSCKWGSKGSVATCHPVLPKPSTPQPSRTTPPQVTTPATTKPATQTPAPTDPDPTTPEPTVEPILG